MLSIIETFNQHKLDFYTQKCIFFCYNLVHKGYKCLDKSGRIYIARHVVFNESEFSYPELFSASNNSSSIPTKCVTPANQSFTHFSLSNPHLDDSNVVAPPIATSEVELNSLLLPLSQVHL